MSVAGNIEVSDTRNDSHILICFAVPNEAKHFRPSQTHNQKVIVTGIGSNNARSAINKALSTCKPKLVLTCGYAGGLNPQLKQGEILYDTDVTSRLVAVLNQLGAKPAIFHCSNRIAVTVEEKRTLREQTNADAVEMESGVIRSICSEQSIPAATIRVISDDAAMNLPMDFNCVSKDNGNISYTKLAGTLLRHPGSIPKLMQFQRELEDCSRRLATLLMQLLDETVE